MVRKRRTDAPSEGGEGSGSREAGPVSGGGRGSQRGGFQQGGGGGQQQGGRGYTPQSQQGGRGGRGYGQPPQQQYQQQQQYGGPQEYQGRGRGGPPHQGGRGGYGGGRGGGPSSGPPQRQSVPELHQATSPTYQAVSSQPTLSEVSPTQVPEPTVLAQQLEQLSVEQGAPSQAIQPIPSSSKAYKFPMRPGKGQSGKRCIVKANHFFAELPDKDLHQYDVTITPEVTSRGVNRAVMKQLVDSYRESHLGNRLPAYDGRKSLYTAGPLPFTSKEFRINLLDEEEGAGGQRREREFKVVIKLVARADLHHLGLFLEGKQPDAPQEALQVLDIVLRELPTSRYTPVGRSFYSPDIGRKQSLGDGLESWRGFYQSIRPTQMGLSLNIGLMAAE